MICSTQMHPSLETWPKLAQSECATQLLMSDIVIVML